MSETKRTSKERAAEFIGALRRICTDRGKLAALRRGLTDNPRLHVDAWPVVASLGGDIGQPIFIAVAALFATHPVESDARNLGETCRRIALGEGKDIPDSFERRFRRLLACGDLDDLIGQLHSWVRLAGSGGRNVGINYESLFADLRGWQWYSEDIRVKWARSFWQSGESNPAENPTAEATHP